MAELTIAQKVANLEAEIEGYISDLASATDLNEKRELRALITARTGTLNLLIGQQQGKILLNSIV